jgi:glycosyltransferase involved in cell wall biosynthesis
MDILAHPSRREGLARAIPQAQLAQAPPIAYDVDGNREGMIPGKTGFSVPAFDKQQFAARIAEFIEDEAKRRAMGLAGREFALSRFDARVMIDGLDAAYAGISPSLFGRRPG